MMILRSRLEMKDAWALPTLPSACGLLAHVSTRAQNNTTPGMEIHTGHVSVIEKGHRWPRDVIRYCLRSRMNYNELHPAGCSL